MSGSGCLTLSTKVVNKVVSVVNQCLNSNVLEWLVSCGHFYTAVSVYMNLSCDVIDE